MINCGAFPGPRSHLFTLNSQTSNYYIYTLTTWYIGMQSLQTLKKKIKTNLNVHLYFIYLFILVIPCGCRILVLQPRIEPVPPAAAVFSPNHWVPPAVEVWSPNYWTPGKGLNVHL
ncbi:unnamed protein product [Rangifer tarandus platyrhynchus]|uniref:Uncharacterized protein n=1 Tax=Rangifer tarandus platyrhynchus TaxID=3082113 RepID=A0AC60A699_RANTA